jgi:hypothetical protein
MVDNFEIIKPLLTFENEGDCYYLQLLRRQSDDPMIDGIPDPGYHGNMYRRSIKDYFITSIDNLEQRKSDIVKLCQTFNVRAYIRLNKRNYKQISLHMLKHIAEQEISGQSFSSPFHLVASAAGLANCAGKDNKTWIVDCDAEHKPHLDKIEQLIFECEPYASSKAILMPLPRIPSKSGVHLIPHPFNCNTFEKLWNQYVIENDIPAAMPQFERDPEYTHFSLTGKNLKRIDLFTQYRDGSGAVMSFDENDKNKTIVHIKNDSFAFDHFEKYWTRQCVEKCFLLEKPDIHKDNPCVLYCP